MNEGEFDKIISKKLKEEGTDYPNLDANWQKIKDKMVQLHDSKPTPGGVVVLPNSVKNGFSQKRWLLPAMLSSLLLLLGVNGWFLWRLTQTTEKNALTSEKQKAGQSARLYDTIIETKVIYRFDTIYKKVIIVQPISAESNLKTSLIEPKNTPSVKEAKSDPSLSYDKFVDGTMAQKEKDKSRVQNAFNTPKTGKIEEEKRAHDASKDLITVEKSNETTNYISNSQASALSFKQETIEKTPNAEVDKQTMNSPLTNRQDTNFLTDSSRNKANEHIDSLNIDAKSPLEDTLKYTKALYDSLELKPSESLQNIINALPKKVIVDHYVGGLQGGVSWFIPTKTGINANEWYGLSGEIAFKRGLRLSVSLDNVQNHFKTTTRDAILNLPTDPPMTENYNLKYIEGSSSSVLAGIGLSYLFKSERRISPFVSVGFARRWVLPYSLEFEFTNKMTGEERSFKIDDTRYHQDNWFNMGFGFETTLESKFLIRLKTEYIYDPNHGLEGINQFLLRGGIFYRF